jgi:magnesium transporter
MSSGMLFRLAGCYWFTPNVLDWIAHGILDSIVDAFFPFLADIEREVTDVDALVYSGPDLVATVQVADAPLPFIMEKQIEDTSFSEKAQRSVDHVNLTQNALNATGVEFSRPRFVFPRPSVPFVFRQLRRFMVTTASFIWRKKMGYRPNTTTTTLRRMTRTRRLVTSLSRLLATKADVVTHIQKRLMRAGHSGLGNGTSKGEEFEVAIYMGDVQGKRNGLSMFHHHKIFYPDHILTLQHSLVHIERMLSQSHLSYLVQLRATTATAKGGQDTAVMILSVVTLGVVCVQSLIGTCPVFITFVTPNTFAGVCSMNVTLPANRLEPGAPFNVFGVVIAMSFIITIVYSWLVRWWWIQAKGPRQDLR